MKKIEIYWAELNEAVKQARDLGLNNSDIIDGLERLLRDIKKSYVEKEIDNFIDTLAEDYKIIRKKTEINWQ